MSYDSYYIVLVVVQMLTGLGNHCEQSKLFCVCFVDTEVMVVLLAF